MFSARYSRVTHITLSPVELCDSSINPIARREYILLYSRSVRARRRRQVRRVDAVMSNS